MIKQCTVCKDYKSLDLFHNNKSSKDGKFYRCKVCNCNHSKKWKEDHPGYYTEYQKEFKLKNPEYYRNYMKNYDRIRKQSDPLYKLAKNMRVRVGDAIECKRWNKNNTLKEYIGCSLEFLKQHIENQFTEGMHWDNNTIHGWHIDHITPLDSAITIEELYKLCHYTNLQPLWGPDNLKKGNKIIK